MTGLAAVGAIWSAIGATTIAGVAVGAALQGAVIGAVVGGLVSAVTGGSILEGVLFGAVGGAVLGGVSGLFGGAGGMGTTGQLGMAATEGGQLVGTFGGLSASGTATGLTTAITGAEGLATSSISAGLTSLGGDIGKEVLGKGIVSGIEGYMGAEAADAALAQQKEESALAREHDIAKMKLAAELSTGVDNTGAKLAYDARMAELGQRKTEFDTATKQWQTELDISEQMKTDRKALFGTGARETGPQEAKATPGESVQEKRTALSIAAAPGGQALTKPTEGI